ncbi:MAG: hypothetical protein HY316_02670 [Acidobacteria bacterium]|nr:hypothetical protein [Acidobacteriota bacterium]
MFISDRPGGLGGTDLYVSHRRNQRDDFGWDLPENLGSGVNSSSTEVTPGSFEDPNNGNFVLYFSSNCPGGQGGVDIYSSVLRNDGIFGPAVLVPELSSAVGDNFPAPRNDGLELYLASNRAGTLGGNDVWVSTRPSTSAPWSTPVNLGPSINSAAGENGTTMPFNRTSLIVDSDRGGPATGRDLYVSTRTKLTGTGPAINAGGVVNATTYLAGPLAPNSLVSIFGTNLATVTAPGQFVSGGYLTNLFGTRVSFNFSGGSIDAPLLYISPLQINAQVPAGLAPGSASVTVTVDGATSAPQVVTIQ